MTTKSQVAGSGVAIWYTPLVSRQAGGPKAIGANEKVATPAPVAVIKVPLFEGKQVAQLANLTCSAIRNGSVTVKESPIGGIRIEPAPADQLAKAKPATDASVMGSDTPA
jgi:hypothetical protein